MLTVPNIPIQSFEMSSSSRSNNTLNQPLNNIKENENTNNINKNNHNLIHNKSQRLQSTQNQQNQNQIQQQQQQQQQQENFSNENENLDPNKSYFSLEEVSKHTSPDDIWMIIYDKVYHVESFLYTHPGGAEVLFDCAGVDATEQFEDVSHSDDAVNMLEPYYVGEILPSDLNLLNDKKKLKRKKKRVPPINYNNKDNNINNIINNNNSNNNNNNNDNNNNNIQKFNKYSDKDITDYPKENNNNNMIINNNKSLNLKNSSFIQKYSSIFFSFIAILGLILYIYLQRKKWSDWIS
ncbi:unnamed protein product [[Candida] boidinii]|uniref:Unnamed protein product n=1 Tax=Candida boidinii TaxID=5477 RepID=A0ACB5U6Q8_CANBO|nr:unnamed protein product [[Candida] boidinii]